VRGPVKGCHGGGGRPGAGEEGTTGPEPEVEDPRGGTGVGLGSRRGREGTASHSARQGGEVAGQGGGEEGLGPAADEEAVVDGPGPGWPGPGAGPVATVASLVALPPPCPPQSVSATAATGGRGHYRIFSVMLPAGRQSP
jgi:hypothetical protein